MDDKMLVDTTLKTSQIKFSSITYISLAIFIEPTQYYYVSIIIYNIIYRDGSNNCYTIIDNHLGFL